MRKPFEGEKNMVKKKRLPKSERKLSVVTIHPELVQFARFMSDVYAKDLNEVLNTMLRLGMHQMAAQASSERVFSQFRADPVTRG